MVPTPDELRERIDRRRQEIAELKRLLRVAQSTEQIKLLSEATEHESRGKEQVSHA